MPGYGPAHEGSPLLAAQAKTGSEPSEPAEGEVTKGTAGVASRQTFKYKGTGGTEQEPVLKHDLGPANFVGAFGYIEEAESVFKALVPSVKVLSTSEVKIKQANIANLAKGTVATFMLFV